MCTTIKGFFDNGQIYFQEKVPVTSKTEVMVTFLGPEKEQVKLKKRELQAA